MKGRKHIPQKSRQRTRLQGYLYIDRIFPYCCTLLYPEPTVAGCDLLEAKTIHCLLEIDPGTGRSTRNESKPVRLELSNKSFYFSCQRPQRFWNSSYYQLSD